MFHVGGSALSLTFDLDPLGNIRASGPAQGNWTERYHYDDLYRLTTVLDGSGSTARDSFAYDATGNRTSRQRQGEPSLPYAYATDSHRLQSVDGFDRVYDAAGNTTYGIDLQATSTYGDHGRLTQWWRARFGEMHYVYNGRGERATKFEPPGSCSGACVGTRFVYDESGRLLGEYTLSGKPVQDYVWLDDTPVAVFQEGVPFYVHSDHLNTPRAIKDHSGKLRWRWDFLDNAFGEKQPDQAPSGEKQFVYNLRFPGQYFDVESGLHYNYFRDYEPGTGRYIESDPIGLRGGLGTFVYALNRPLVLSDPRGLQVIIPRPRPVPAPVPFPPGSGTEPWNPDEIGYPGPRPDGRPDSRPSRPDGRPMERTNDGDVCEDDYECQAKYVECLSTELADMVGGNYGQSKCYLCRETCVQRGGRWDSISHTGDRCDYWNFGR